MFKRKTPYQKGMNALKDKKFGVAKKELLKASDDANNPDGSRRPRPGSPLTVHRVHFSARQTRDPLLQVPGLCLLRRRPSSAANVD